VIQAGQGKVDRFRFLVQIVLDIAKHLIADVLIGVKRSGVEGLGKAGMEQGKAKQDQNVLFQLFRFGK